MNKMGKRIWGKVIGGILGLLALGPLGLILGLWIGHAFDKAFVSVAAFTRPEMRLKMQENFFQSAFTLLGYIAKADGRVSEAEVSHTETLIAHMGLDADGRRRAIEFFKQGVAASFQPEPVVSEFLTLAGRHPQLKQTLLLFLISLAYADGSLDSMERNALDRVGRLLGFSEAQIAHLLRMAQAQGQFHQRQSSSGISDIKVAYDALDVSASATDAEVKRAYRKLMSENHPDKLMARGVPDSMIKLATEKSQEIQAAYELIKKTRSA